MINAARQVLTISRANIEGPVSAGWAFIAVSAITSWVLLPSSFREVASGLVSLRHWLKVQSRLIASRLSRVQARPITLPRLPWQDDDKHCE